jgi:hypothetical protein
MCCDFVVRRLLAVIAVLGVGCGGGPRPGAAVGFDDFCSATYDPPGERETVRVAIDGWLVKPGKMTVCEDLCKFEIAEHADGSGRRIRYSVRIGPEKNRLQPLNERFVPEDWKLRTQSDELLGFGDAVRLHGGRAGMAERRDCELHHVDLIEKPATAPP